MYTPIPLNVLLKLIKDILLILVFLLCLQITNNKKISSSQKFLLLLIKTENISPLNFIFVFMECLPFGYCGSFTQPVKNLGELPKNQSFVLILSNFLLLLILKISDSE